MPRLIDDEHCPHCGEPLPTASSRSCPSCAGSLQQRYLKMGCLSSAPGILLLAWVAWEQLGTS